MRYFEELVRRRNIVALCRAGAAATRAGEAAAGRHGLGLTQYLVLGMLAATGPRSQQELSDGLRTDRTTMVGAVDGLERSGLVGRQRNPANRRAYIVTVTDAGRKTLAAVDADADALEDDLFDGLSPAERAQLVGLLQRVLTP